MQPDRLNPFNEQVLVYVINIVLVLTEYNDRWGRLLESIQQMHQLFLLLNILHFL